MSDLNKAVLKLANQNPEFKQALQTELAKTGASVLLKGLAKSFADGKKSADPLGDPGASQDVQAFKDLMAQAQRVLTKLSKVKNWHARMGPGGMATGDVRVLMNSIEEAAWYAGALGVNSDGKLAQENPEFRQGSRPVFLDMNKLWKTLPKRGHVRNAIELKNGTILSIQANEGAYSEPRKDNAAYYTAFEVFVKGPSLPELRPFAEGAGNHTFVPVGVLNKILKRYGYAGLAYKSRSKRADKQGALPYFREQVIRDFRDEFSKDSRLTRVPKKNVLWRWERDTKDTTHGILFFQAVLRGGATIDETAIKKAITRAAKKTGIKVSAPKKVRGYGTDVFQSDVQFPKTVTAALAKRADKWETKPKGWTDASRKKFWESLTSAAPKHKVTECIKRMDKHMGGNAGAFCASLADRVTPGWRKEVSKDKKKASLTQPLSLRRDYGAGSDDEWLGIDEVRKHCPPCADKMAANNVRKVKASTLRLAMQRR